MNHTLTHAHHPRRSAICTLSIAVLTAVFALNGSSTRANDADAPIHLQMAEANNHFGFDAFERLSKQNAGQNVFFSPYSISSALMMAASGAVDQTADEMQQVLHLSHRASEMQPAIALLNKQLLGDDRDKVKELRGQIAELQEQLATVKAKLKTVARAESAPLYARQRDLVKKLNAALPQIDQYELKIANSIWGDKSYPFNPDFVSDLKNQHNAGGLIPVDFIGNADAARLRINGWVEDQTNNRIQDLLAQGSLTSDTRMVLVNAVYFKGDWKVPFDKRHTQTREFHLTDGTTKKVPLMVARGNKQASYAAFNADGSAFDTPKRIGMKQTDGLYPEDGGFAMVELPYKGDDVSMVLVAPFNKDGLPQIEAMLNAQSFASWISGLQKRSANITMPKFRLEASYNLGTGGSAPRGLLPKMGMPRAFTTPDSTNGAQLDRMTASDDPGDKLFFSAAVHKAFLEVDEQGTEAAAATAIVGEAMTSAIHKTKSFIPSFVADRPFLTIIRDRATGVILFMGRIENPDQA